MIESERSIYLYNVLHSHSRDLVTYEVSIQKTTKQIWIMREGGIQFLKTKIVQVMMAEHKVVKLLIEMNNHKLNKKF